MSRSVLLGLLLAVLLFWATGAYNRLMRLRSGSIAAFAGLETVLSQYLPLVQTHQAQSPATGSATQAAWANLSAAAQQFHISLKVAQAQPLNAPTINALKTAHETLCLSWSRLQELAPDLNEPALPPALQTQWQQITVQAELARAEFNQRLAHYNRAISQFPALLLAWLFDFKPTPSV